MLESADDLHHCHHLRPCVFFSSLKMKFLMNSPPGIVEGLGRRLVAGEGILQGGFAEREIQVVRY